MTPEFGTTAWGRAWLRLAEPITAGSIDTRLPKARALPRRGYVENLVTGPGLVDALVRVRDREYPVRLSFDLWGTWAHERIAAFVREDPTAVQLLTSGDAPDELADAVGEAIAPTPDELDARCPCRERCRPCLHQLGVLYALVQRIDEEPVTALALRGWEWAAIDGEPGADRGTGPRDRIPLASLDPFGFYRWREFTGHG
ncbi:hypothetical protein AD006_32370 (plasmid) [Pseudonocardia sp. EC080610-09]|uniref:hypothetical protein n=1 Tax=Pseudonocardia sp. EC080610-09 TaxID=1688404 RepID=UPI000705CBAE|nr:hypothetical protein [Pseudonocardia sp. EC080610-09]ALL79928.1 hypothetical protein AD006_32370 [Pseudonocardia sp. EC080610-09]